MAFSCAQLKKLANKLDRQHVQTRSMGGRDIDYIEGWFAIAEANAIFGFGGWDREMVHFERLFERTRDQETSCAYLARVRIAVHAGATRVVREGTGLGSANCKNASDAHERAIKAAETDATKRALATFGNRFGLGLYDKEQVGVTARIAQSRFILKDGTGAAIATELSGEAFCSGLKQIVQKLICPEELQRCQSHNADELGRLRIEIPTLRSGKGEHFAEILEKLFSAKLAELLPTPAGSGELNDGTARDVNLVGAVYQPNTPLASSFTPGPGPRMGIDKASLPIAVTRRVRDKDHLRHIATLPCLICEQLPSHAHHLTFAQPRGLGLKVSDEYVVPLCAIHHNEVHRSGAEALWWKRSSVEPLGEARGFWEARLSAKDVSASRVA
jgi:DNA recombination protein Rad52